MRRRPRLAATAMVCGLLISLPGAGAVAETPSAGLGQVAELRTSTATPDLHADDEVQVPVSAKGAAPVVESIVSGVVAPYPLATNTNAKGTRTISLEEAAAGTAWKQTTLTAQSCPASGDQAARGLTPSATGVLNCLHIAFPEVGTFLGVGHRSANSASDHPSGRAVDVMIDNWQTPQGKALGWRVARFVEDNAEELNVKYVIWDAQIWVPGGSWRGYRHPSGARDPNNAHLNHVHVSVHR